VPVDEREHNGAVVPAASLFVRTQGRRRHSSNGNNNNNDEPVIVLIHGTSGSNEYMRCVQELLSADYYTVAIDLRGHGLSEQTDPALVPYTHEVMADDVFAVMEALGANRNIVWVGVSLGGSLGLVYANRHAAHVSRLVALSAGPGLYRVPACAADGACVEGVTCAVCWNNSIPVSGNPTTLFPEPSCDGAQLAQARAKVAQNQARAGAVVGSGVIPYSWTQDLRPLLAGVRVPTAIGYGSADPLQPHGGSSRYMHEAIDNSVLVKFVGKGHLMTVTDAPSVAQVVRMIINGAVIPSEMTAVDDGTCSVCAGVVPTDMSRPCDSRTCAVRAA
jgi:pimeloyl-ACP methyl ester carboxylesterase